MNVILCLQIVQKQVKDAVLSYMKDNNDYLFRK